MYAKIENNEIVKTTTNLRKEFPNTSFPKILPDEYNGWVKVEVVDPAPPIGEKVAMQSVELVDGMPTTVYVYEAIPASELIRHLDSYYTQKLRGGIMVGEAFIATDTEDRSLINGAVTRAVLEGDDAKTHSYYPTGGGVIDLSNAQYKAIGMEVANHVQACLDAQDVVLEDIGNYQTFEEVETAFDAAYAEAGA